MLDRAVISAVNWCEVIRRALAHGAQIAALTGDAEAAGSQIVPFDSPDAARAATLGLEARSHGLPLADWPVLPWATGLEPAP
jgi:PIN domain nuclease of toxin-antitoxin system